MQNTNIDLSTGSEDFCFNDEDLIVINESFKTNLPTEHQHNLTKLFSKLTVAPVGEIFATPFNSEKTLITYAKLDYVRSGLTFDRKLDEVDKLILNSIYSFYRAGNVLFITPSTINPNMFFKNFMYV